MTADAFEAPDEAEPTHQDGAEGPCAPETGCTECWPHADESCPPGASCRVCGPTI